MNIRRPIKKILKSKRKNSKKPIRKNKKQFLVTNQQVPVNKEYGFSFSSTINTPARWNFNEELYFQTNTLYDGKEFAHYIPQAFDELEKYINKKIINKGNIEYPSLYDIYDSDVPHNTIVIVFTNGQLSPILDGNFYAFANIYCVDVRGDQSLYKIVGAKIIIDMNRLEARGWSYLYKLLLHELGHTMNLAHVADKNHIMNDQIIVNNLFHYHPGDQEGLKIASQRVF
jgi:hypothetical protein